MNASLENELQVLSDGLDQGLFVGNLEPQIETTKRILRLADGEILVAGYVVQSVLADLQTLWADCPLAPSNFELVNAEIGPALKRVVTAMIRPAERVFLTAHLEALVSRFLALQHSNTLR